MKDEVKGKVVGVSSIIGDVVSAVRGMLKNSALLLFIALILILIIIFYTIVIIQILREERISKSYESGTIEKQ